MSDGEVYQPENLVTKRARKEDLPNVANIQVSREELDEVKEVLAHLK